jgi:hypothetical protein
MGRGYMWVLDTIYHLLVLWGGVLKKENPQVPMGFNTKIY